MINRKWRKSLLDVRVMRNADIGSDHNLLVAKLALKLRKTKVGESKNKQFDAIRLQDQAVRTDFSVALRNRFDILQDEALMTSTRPLLRQRRRRLDTRRKSRGNH